jgi:hypothetical protein
MLDYLRTPAHQVSISSQILPGPIKFGVGSSDSERFYQSVDHFFRMGKFTSNCGDISIDHHSV